jgi:hypothetical protein
MSANHFVLRHHDVEVEYTVGVTPGIPALTYCDGSSPKKTLPRATPSWRGIELHGTAQTVIVPL